MKIVVPKSGYIRIKVTPNAPKTELFDISQENIDGRDVTTYKIRLNAPPEKGKANQELIHFLTKHMNLPPNTFTIISGKTDRLKLLKIHQH
ncbi:DUF167 domain-containing protein [Candidatus Peregrinibacteria bacterium]|jgi:uncharacterized protein|nr:DUF167 domain-containing protein [Candidatus Peregrinibacteria bacterium]MBT4147888.1 DUF167 domain-containing protein [Candidatus Peregrinibacteria bacterium]MBT4365905.1 DUF167 domain-containing protein [Candidatus Peregrinibacteria bacterium]MBT4456379.1 DUF167 domain-containing protein [Candidatus Peregrinibacteria bacterium]